MKAETSDEGSGTRDKGQETSGEGGGSEGKGGVTSRMILHSWQAGFTGHPHAAAAAVSSAAETPAHRKLRRAAQAFEGILLEQLLGGFTAGPSSLAGQAAMAGSQTINSLAIEAVATALAQRGGLGIARMVMRQLEPKPASSVTEDSSGSSLGAGPRADALGSLKGSHRPKVSSETVDTPC